MFESLQIYANFIGVSLAAMSVGASWVSSIASPNCSYDKIDGSRADRHVRELIYATALGISGLLLASAMLFLLGTSWIAAVTAMMGAFGFYATRMMLAPKEGKNKQGVKTSRKKQRAYGLSFSLVFTVVAFAAMVLGVFQV